MEVLKPKLTIEDVLLMTEEITNLMNKSLKIKFPLKNVTNLIFFFIKQVDSSQTFKGLNNVNQLLLDAFDKQLQNNYEKIVNNLLNLYAEIEKNSENPNSDQQFRFS